MGFVLILVMIIWVRIVANDKDLSSSFSSVLMVIPIIALITVSIPRTVSFILIFLQINNLSRRRLMYRIRSITSILLFGLSLCLLVLLILAYKGSDTFTLTLADMAFLASDEMKWGIILLAMSVVVSTLFDLYFSLAIRTFYLNLANGFEQPNQEELLK